MPDFLRRLLAARGYRVYERPYELNIVGVRNTRPIHNSFDDTIHVFYKTNTGGWQLHSWPATTDPGTYWLKNLMNPSGTAILKPGQYVGSHAIGMHRGKYKAVVQVKPVTVLRDTNRDATPDYTTTKEQTGLFGINIHRASIQGTTKVIDKFSAGCQVFANIEDFNHFMGLAEKHRSLYGNSFTYTLVMGSVPSPAVAGGNVSGVTPLSQPQPV